MKRALMATWVVLLVFGSELSGVLKPKRGWVTIEHLDQAVAHARKKNTPIAFLYALSTTTCPKHNIRANSYMRDKSLGGMVKVLVYSDKPVPRLFGKVRDQIAPATRLVPRIYITDPQLRVIAFIKGSLSGTPLARLAAMARGNLAWQNKTASAIRKADDAVALGKFRAAMKTYKKAEKGDREQTVLIARMWDETLRPDEVELKFFSELAEKASELVRQAQARLDKATELYENEKYAEAGKLLGPMVKDKAELTVVKKATELLKKVRKALREKP